MDLGTYFKKKPRGEARRLAAELRVSEGAVSDWATGRRCPSLARAMAIKKATRNWVKPGDLFAFYERKKAEDG